MVWQALAVAVAVVLSVGARDPRALRVDGRFFAAGDDAFRPVFTSGLTLLSRSDAERTAFLDEARALGFNGVRVFAGALTWAQQTPAQARERLPSLLADAASRGLYVEVTAVTDSRSGYDVEAHLRSVAAICARSTACLLEAANEYYHPTQSALVQDAARLFAVARRTISDSGPPWSLGAPPFDDLRQGQWPVPAGDFITVHLDRGRPFWQQLAHVRALARISERTGKPVINNEPIGAAEKAQRGRRETDPRFFFALGAMSRLVEVGAVFHSESGLAGRTLGPTERACASAFVAGFNSIPTAKRLTLADPGSASSPIVSIRGASHVFTATDGERWWGVLLDVSATPAVRWRTAGSAMTVIAQRPNVQVVEVHR